MNSSLYVVQFIYHSDQANVIIKLYHMQLLIHH